MDYYNFLFDKNKKLYNLMCHYFKKLINDIEYDLKILIKNKNDINYLLKLIDNLEYGDYQYIKLSYKELLN